jgi:hypothetical protein
MYERRGAAGSSFYLRFKAAIYVHTSSTRAIKGAVAVNRDKVVRGKFRLGENQFPSSREKTMKIVQDIARINRKMAEKRSRKKN